jgi:hypothetical protein
MVSGSTLARGGSFGDFFAEWRQRLDNLAAIALAGVHDPVEHRFRSILAAAALDLADTEREWADLAGRPPEPPPELARLYQAALAYRRRRDLDVEALETALLDAAREHAAGQPEG